jgi:hypothetical protein
MLILFSGLTACRKEVVEDPIEPNEPVFRADGTLGYDDFSVVAGDDNFYMSTFTQTVHGVELFSGKLSDGNFEIEMGVFNGNIDLPAGSLPENLPSQLYFAGIPQQPVLQLSKQMFPNSDLIDQIKWYVNGQYAGMNTMVINEPGKYSVCAEVSFMSGNEGVVCNDMIVGYQKNASSVLRHFVSPGGDLQVWLEEPTVPISSIDWYFDDNYAGSSDKLIDEIDDDIHSVKAVVTYSNGVVRSKSMLLDGSAGGGYLDDFSIFENSPTPYSRDYAVTLIVRKNGVDYTSMNAPNNGSSFQVQDVQYYDQNTSGNPVVKLTASLDCMLRNNSTGEIVPFSGTVQFGVEVE